ncbi:MAG: hypothetical protein P4L90_27140 [Rhodopila sp.]|nr:hypothetical protein [Rhodopila sp.]
MSSRAILAALAVVAVGAATFTAPALARGGSGGRGGFVAGVPAAGFRARVVVASPHAGVAVRRVRPVLVPSPLFLSGAFTSPNGPFVIVVRPVIVPTAIVPQIVSPIVPPFTAATAIVPPFGPGQVAPSFVRLPIVVTPTFGSPEFAGAVIHLPAVAAPSRALVDGIVTQTAGAPVGNLPETRIATTRSVIANASPAACHPIPSGYHCDWPS